MSRLNYPRIFGIAALLILGVTVAEMALNVNLKVLRAVLVVACAAGMIGIISIHGTGPPYPLPPDER